jgi:serine protease Do
VEAVGHAESLSKAFRNAADQVLPTVVKIKSRTTRRVVRGSNRPGENPFRGTPFEDFFDRDDFAIPFDRMPRRREGTGSGVVINEDGLIMTNNHVVTGADVVTVELPDGRVFEAEDIRTDPKTDLAVLRIKGAGRLREAKLGDSDAVRIGDWVLAVGNPFELEASVSAGIISAKGRSLGSAERASFLQTDAAINPGNSGGPLVNLRGEIVGINTAIASSSGGYQGIGFAIPINLAKWVTGKLVSEGAVKRAWLGVGIAPVDPEIAETLGIDAQTVGVVVQHVGNDTPAERAGVRPGDVITHFAGQEVAGPTQLQRAVERAKLGSRQPLNVIRRGRKMKLTVTTEALPEEDAVVAERSSDPSEDDMVDLEALGMRIADINDDIAKRLKLSDEEGVVVMSTSSDGIATRSGITRGMLILEVGGQPISSVDEFEAEIEKGSLDRGIPLTVKIPKVGTRFVILKDR